MEKPNLAPIHAEVEVGRAGAGLTLQRSIAVPLTLRMPERGFLIMGDKSPKANQKHKSQQAAKANSATQRMKQQAAAVQAAPKKK